MTKRLLLGLARLVIAVSPYLGAILIGKELVGLVALPFWLQLGVFGLVWMGLVYALHVLVPDDRLWPDEERRT